MTSKKSSKKSSPANSGKYKLGIALGGGGARGFAHLGVLQALYDQDIKPEIYAGVSAGSIVGAFISSGMSPEEVFDVMKSRKFYQYAGLLFPKKGLLSLTGLREDLEQHIDVDRLEDLEIPLIVGAVNLNKARLEFFDSGEISKVIIASSSIPVLFSPVEINGDLYCDGGLFQNIPVEPLSKRCKKIIAVNVSPVEKTSKLNNLVQISTRVFQLSVESNSRNIADECDLLIEPKELSEFEILETKHAEDMYRIGYEYTKSLDIQL